jgi:hypothetical protein
MKKVRAKQKAKKKLLFRFIRSTVSLFLLHASLLQLSPFSFEINVPRSAEASGKLFPLLPLCRLSEKVITRMIRRMQENNAEIRMKGKNTATKM